MNGREWKPGDVAMVTNGSDEWRGIVRPRRESIGADLEVAYAKGGFDMVDDLAEGYEIRPLVVIDPEDREQVERFREIASRWADQVPYSDMREPGGIDHTDAMQAALREFANPTPPKPAEPTGLGAVVEDADGERWIRGADVELGGGVWLRELVMGGGSPLSKQYAAIPAVRVLSEGVTQ